MPVDYNFKRRIDLPSWHWLSAPPGISYPGNGITYDGDRYIYVVQQNVSASAASTTNLWRFDTWTNSWQVLGVVTSSFNGTDLEYDSVRNVLYITHGLLTSWQVFNLNLTAQTIAGVVCQPFVLTTMTPVLPAAAALGSSITMPSDPASTTLDTLTVGTGSTTTSIITSSNKVGPGLVGTQIRFTTGALAGQRRIIAGAVGPVTITLSTALSSVPGVGDEFVVELPTGTAASATTTTLTTTDTMPVNIYSNSDILITGGTGAGQRRRIASHTATVFTLAAAVTGNPRTGAWTTVPDTTSTYRVIPSSDFLYFQVGASTTLSRLDVVANPAGAWTAMATTPGASGGGANTFFPESYSPFSIMMLRGATTAALYRYSIGTNTWATETVFAGSETFLTGAASCMLHGEKKLFVAKEATTRGYIIDLTTGVLEPFATLPYAPPIAYDGKRVRFVKTPDGVKWLYLMRAGGQEFFRLPCEWL